MDDGPAMGSQRGLDWSENGLTTSYKNPNLDSSMDHCEAVTKDAGLSDR
jgi:hypothetical protein